MSKGEKRLWLIIGIGWLVMLLLCWLESTRILDL